MYGSLSRLYSLLLVYISIFLPIPFCLDYCSSGLLNLSTIEILTSIILCWIGESYPVHCRMFSSIPGLYPVVCIQGRQCFLLVPSEFFCLFIFFCLTLGCLNIASEFVSFFFIPFSFKPVYVFLFKICLLGNSLDVQWLELSAFAAEGPGSIPGWGTKIP